MNFKNNFWNQITKYKFNSIFFKYFKFIILVTLIPFLALSFIIYINNCKTEKELIINELNYNADYCVEAIAAFYLTTTQIGKEIFNDEHISTLLSVDEKNRNTDFIDDAIFEFKTITSSYKTSNEAIANIHLYTPHSNYVYSTNNSNYFKYFQDAKYYDEYIKSNYKKIIMETENNGQKYISFFMKNSIASDFPGLLIVQFYRENFQKSFENKYVKDSNTLIKLIDSQSREIIIDFSENTNFNQESSTEIIKKTQLSDISLLIASDLNIYTHSLNTIKNTTLPYIFLILIITFAIAYIISMNFYKSVTQIVTKIESSTLNTLELSKNELSYINDNILNTIAKTKNLEQELAVNIAGMEQYQVIALQSQINPHFLFNTLNTAHALMYREIGKETTSLKIIRLLCDLYGDLINNKSYITTVEKELGYAKKYSEIELIRNRGTFNVLWDIAEDAKHLFSLKMILQPIIENSIIHGIKRITDDRLKIIRIKVFRTKEDLYYKITDNGIGMTDEKLKNITEKLISTKELQSKHIGLININSRIKILYGDNYGVSVKSDFKGTEVTIKLPILDKI